MAPHQTIVKFKYYRQLKLMEMHLDSTHMLAELKSTLNHFFHLAHDDQTIS